MKTLYHSYDQSIALFKEYAELYPDLLRLHIIGKTWEGREIVQITLTQNVAEAENKPALLYTGTQHAREWVGHELAVSFVSYVVQNIDYDPVIQQALRDATLYLVPCVNPDGFEFSRNHFSFWRKNKRVNNENSYGVDLNRNFPIGYHKVDDVNSNVYSGPHPLSEPETQALSQFIDSHENISIALDYHSQGNVFFPAHDFRHEDTIDTTDMNVLCANMAYEIRRVSDRAYGIHQGKPPTKLISGSAREYCYSKGIIAAVVEVGTRNISDYLDDMQEHLLEHHPALIKALQEVPNYAKNNPLKRVEQFQIKYIDAFSVELCWLYEGLDDSIYFEVYRNTKDKQSCNHASLLGRTHSCWFKDDTVQSCQDYFYYVRAVNAMSGLKSPFAPRIQLHTPVTAEQFHRMHFCIKHRSGYVSEKSEKNRDHFGVNSLFAGVSETKGISYSIISFNLEGMPENAEIQSAKLSVYPMNRVPAAIERFGEWYIGLVSPLNEAEKDLIYEFDGVKDLDIDCYIGRPIASEHLTQGIWQQWIFSGKECEALSQQIAQGEVVLRMEGPTELRLGRHSQMMQWDLGYGQYASGINYRPKLEITYTLEPQRFDIFPEEMMSYNEGTETIYENRILSGFHNNGEKIRNYLIFNLSSLPSYEKHIVTDASMRLCVSKVDALEKVRFHLELVTLEDNSDIFPTFKILERIGYDVFAKDLENEQELLFKFSSFSLNYLSDLMRKREKVFFILRPTSSRPIKENNIAEWYVHDKQKAPCLSMNVIPKRRFPVTKVRNLKWQDDNGKLKLTWENPLDDDFCGVRVIKNAFREPKSPYDGDKVYGGKDNYTYDSFGARDITKYYAVFTYDEVPNFSEPTVIQYQPTPQNEKKEQDKKSKTTPSLNMLPKKMAEKKST